MFNFPKNLAPARPPRVATRDVRGDGWHVQLDLTPQVLSLSIPEETTGNEHEEELAPTCQGLSHGFISASMLAVKAKLFDDGLYAGTELSAQPLKRKLLSPLVSVAPTMAAAARLGGIDAPFSAEAQRITQAFLADELASKPLGFYTWSDALAQIYQQDRLLQQPLDAAHASALNVALDAEPTAKALYAAHLDFVARLTNPWASGMRDLREPGGRCFFPPSRSHESDLVERLYADRPIPDAFSLADEMIKGIRAGSLRLDPTDSSGWYDWQTWALEPLVVPDRTPEGTRLRMNEAYREQLTELFKAILSLTRETHVKQLYNPFPGASLPPRDPRTVVRVSPELTVEPVRTYYERRALGYQFVRSVLPSLGPLHLMRRLTPEGAAEARPLDEELDEMVTLFEGAAAVAGHELGIEAATEPQASRFREWATTPDMADDVRMMAPVFFDVGRRQTKVWAILGWATRLLHVSFATEPTAHVLKGDVDLRFDPTIRWIAYPVFAEAYVTTVLNRAEFRAHCDRYKTRTRILEQL
ncbi:MAG: hypothetical protein ABIQ52_10095 [Vicinamibacterales bacterium]